MDSLYQRLKELDADTFKGSVSTFSKTVILDLKSDMWKAHQVMKASIYIRVSCRADRQSGNARLSQTGCDDLRGRKSQLRDSVAQGEDGDSRDETTGQ